MSAREPSVDLAGYSPDPEGLSGVSVRGPRAQPLVSSRRARALSTSRRKARRARAAALRSASAGSSSDSGESQDRAGRSARKGGPTPRRQLRPSLIVPEPELGSGSDAGVLPESRIPLRNRRRAAVLLCDALDPSGNPSPCFDFQLFFPPNSKYNRRLTVPTSDLVHAPCRAPAEFLSVNVRKRFVKPGTLSVKYGKSSWKHRQPKLPWYAATDIDDESVCCTGSSSDIRTKKSSDEAVKGEASHTKEVVLSSRSSSTEEGEVHDEQLTRPSEDLFAALLAKARQNPETVLGGSSPPEKLSSKAKTLEGGVAPIDVMHTSKEEATRKDGNVIDADTQGLEGLKEGVCDGRKSGQLIGGSSAYVDAAMAGLRFCGAVSDMNLDKNGRPTLVKSWPKPSAGKNEPGIGEFEHHTKQFGSRMLEKMGFTGRLGARGQGIANPLEGRPPDGRHGLGAAAAGGRAGGKAPDKNSAVPTFDAYDSVIAAFTGKARRADGKGNDLNSRKRKREAETGGISSSPRVPHDVFSSRRRLEKPTQDSQPMAQSGNGSIHRESRPQAELNEDSEHETENSGFEDEFDNGRRGIIVDFDALVNGSYERRLRAYAAASSAFEGIRPSFDVSLSLFENGLDLGDEDATRRILLLNDLDTSDGTVDAFGDQLDGAFRRLDEPAPNLALLNLLKEVSQDCHIGLIHKGSRARLNRELRCLNLSTGFLNNAPKVTLEVSDTSPYLSSMKELMCRLGTTARQTLIVSSDNGMRPNSSFLVAGRVLGTKTVVSVDTIDRNVSADQLKGGGNGQKFDSDHWLCDGRFSSGAQSFGPLLEWVKPQRKHRRVLSLYEKEGLWYAGREVYRCQVPNCDDQKVFVKYYKWENEEWVDLSNVEPLKRRHYRVLKDADFQGLMDPADIEDLL